MMKKEKAYCQRCDDDVLFEVRKTNRNATIRNVKFLYPFIEAYCKECGERVFPVSVGRINSIALFDGYKKKVGLLTSEDIVEIREKCGLTQKQFAKELGCGEKTITRYENGAIQDKSMDNLIREYAKKTFKDLYVGIRYDTIVSSYKQKKDQNLPDVDFKHFSYKIPFSNFIYQFGGSYE